MNAGAMHFSLRGRRVLLTGAGGGLGHGVSLALLRQGARVLALDRDSDALARLREAVSPDCADALQTLQVDLADAAALQQTLDRLTADAALDVVINNAAVYPSKPFEAYSDDERALIYRVNVSAALQIIRASLPGMRDQRWGRIINITSITLSGGWEHLQPYVESKGAMMGNTRALAREFGSDGITCNAISPGAFPTAAEAIHHDLPAYERMVLERQSIKRRGRAEDIAAAIVFFASDEAAFVTGQTLAVDGGWVMH
ncbi:MULTISPECIES: SDR family oxidoreductase [unclassified Caballeronia]|uniref:SDR family NAD(P)-dependent oxidoreductase n=1 Tax=unclassified Caballeronia TaxID=2646786 RepID=UPI002858F1E4|nr:MULTISPECIES: SDR family oxidoreductase [unclassified Caballeronia]MDR5741046.1 SDR family oxidoreductase [Caballeronia sp. LZ016]MDR5806944.1 SDR family oxidoreductase [Caballeronia sp. LZ019]